MTTARALAIGDKALLPRAELEGLVKLAEQSEPISLQIEEKDIPTIGIAWLADHGGAFDFWRDQGGGIYPAQDGEPQSGQ
jgi:hypothetical protein